MVKIPVIPNNQYCKELFKAAILKTSGLDICSVAINSLSDSEIHVSKIVTVTLRAALL
jgi:hypothetical protein